MNRILVIADTHRNVTLATQAIQSALPLDGVVHLGDLLQDARELEHASRLPFWSVAGNNDWYIDAPQQLVFTIEQVRILACHGHRYDLNPYHPPREMKRNLDMLVHDAKKAGAHCVLFGHTHAAFCKKRDGLLMVNPGSMYQGEKTVSYALLIIEGSTVKAKIHWMKA